MSSSTNRAAILLLGLAALASAGCPVEADPQLRADLDAVTQRIEELEVALADREARIEELEAKTAPMEVEGDAVRLVGVNLYIQNGEGDTMARRNGVGNLIVGYDEGPESDKLGSHNIIVGPDHTYSGLANIVSGRGNVVVDESVILGASFSDASNQSVVIGGHNNDGGAGSVVIGGHLNEGSADGSVIIAGKGNLTLGSYSAVLGGEDGRTNDDYEVAP